MDVAKGVLYLPGCQVKVEASEERLFLRTSGGKVYYLRVCEEVEDGEGGGGGGLGSASASGSSSAPVSTSAPVSSSLASPSSSLVSKSASKVSSSSPPSSSHRLQKLLSWSKAMEYAMECARGFRDVKVSEGSWLQKRGGKSHGYVNWKKRRFMLRGNLLLYYSEDPELFDVFAHLKGFIDLASITSVDARENASDEVGKHFYFKLVVDNEREFYIAAATLEQKNAWMKAIRKQTKALADRMHYSNLRSVQKTEKVLVSGEMLRLSKSGHSQLKTYVVLTNIKLRYYDNEHDFDIHSFGSKMIASIPLLGCGTKLEDDGITISLHDLQAHTFTFIGKDNKDADRWMIAIRTASRALITSILSKNISISLNTYAIGKKGEDLGYTIAKLDAKALTIIVLLLDKEKRLEWDEVDKVALKDTKFILKYTRRRTGAHKTIEFKSANAIAFFDTISCVMSLREEIEAKERKRLSKASAKSGSSSSASASTSVTSKGQASSASAATTKAPTSSASPPGTTPSSPPLPPLADAAGRLLKRNSSTAIPISPNMVHERASPNTSSSSSSTNGDATNHANTTSPRAKAQKPGITVSSASKDTDKKDSSSSSLSQSTPSTSTSTAPTANNNNNNKKKKKKPAKPTATEDSESEEEPHPPAQTAHPPTKNTHHPTHPTHPTTTTTTTTHEDSPAELPHHGSQSSPPAKKEKKKTADAPPAPPPATLPPPTSPATPHIAAAPPPPLPTPPSDSSDTYESHVEVKKKGRSKKPEASLADAHPEAQGSPSPPITATLPPPVEAPTQPKKKKKKKTMTDSEE